MVDGEYVKSKVINNGGLDVEFNQTLELNNVFKMVRQSESIIFEALDKDTDADDLIGKANSLSFDRLTQDEEQKSIHLELFDNNFKQTGSLEVIIQYV